MPKDVQLVLSEVESKIKKFANISELASIRYDAGNFTVHLEKDARKLTLSHKAENTRSGGRGLVELFMEDPINGKFEVVMSEESIDDFPWNVEQAYGLSKAFFAGKYQFKKGTWPKWLHKDRLVFDLDQTYRIASRKK